MLLPASKPKQAAAVGPAERSHAACCCDGLQMLSNACPYLVICPTGILRSLGLRQYNPSTEMVTFCLIRSLILLEA